MSKLNSLVISTTRGKFYEGGVVVGVGWEDDFLYGCALVSYKEDKYNYLLICYPPQFNFTNQFLSG